MNEQKFIKAISQYKQIGLEIKQLQEKQMKRREYIHSYVSKFGSQDYEGSKCFVQDRSKILYDLAKIKERFGKRSEEFIEDSIKFDTRWFYKVCKKNAINPKIFLKDGNFIREESVNEKDLNKLLDQGDISISELDGCFTIDKKESLVIRLSKDDF